MIRIQNVEYGIVRGSIEFQNPFRIDPFFDLTRVHNTGAAFGMLNGVEFPYKTAVLSLVALAVIAGAAVSSDALGTAPATRRVIARGARRGRRPRPG